MFACVVEVTYVVLTTNTACEAPAATVTEAGTVAAALSLLIATETPFAPAGLVNVTVPMELLPENTDVVFRPREAVKSEVRSRDAVVVIPPVDAEIVAVTAVATGVVEMVKVVDLLPWPIVTDAGTDAEVELDAKATTVPPDGAGRLRVTVPIELAPPTSVVGLKLIPERSATFSVRFAVSDELPKVPVMVALVEVDTIDVVIGNVTLVAPAGTQTVGGTETLLLFDARVTGSPPLGAAVLRVMVPVAAAPPSTVVGETVSWLRVAEVNSHTTP